MNRWNRFAAALAVACSLGPSGVLAEATSATFAVHIRLDNSGICVSEALSEETNALVNVTCSNAQFVNISPAANKPFLGTHGGAFRFYFDAQDRLAMAPQSFPYSGVGTITALRIYNADGRDGSLEMMVTF